MPRAAFAGVALSTQSEGRARGESAVWGSGACKKVSGEEQQCALPVGSVASDAPTARRNLEVCPSVVGVYHNCSSIPRRMVLRLPGGEAGAEFEREVRRR